MRRLFLLPLLALLLPARVPAQSAGAIQFSRPQPSLDACPIGFSVSRSSTTEIIQTDNTPHDPDSQQIDLHFQPVADRGLRSVELVVHVLAGGPALLPAGQSTPGDASSAESRSFHLDLNRAGALRHRITLDHVNGILSVDLTALRYVDGQVWRSPAGLRCRAVPSLLLPVAAR